MSDFESIYQIAKDPWDNHKYPLIGKERIKEALKLIPDKRYPQILDIGCGDGYSSHLLSEYGHVLGIDISPTAIQHAKLYYASECQFEVGDIRHLMYAQKFDLICCLSVLTYFKGEELDSILRSISLLLNKEGIAVFQVTVLSNDAGYFDKKEIMNRISKHFFISKTRPASSVFTMGISRMKFIPDPIKTILNLVFIKLAEYYPKTSWHLTICATLHEVKNK